MNAAGWQLNRHWPGGADFVSHPKVDISTGVHVILTFLTCLLWLPIWIILELTSGKTKWCRLTIDEQGQAQYQETGPPR